MALVRRFDVLRKVAAAEPRGLSAVAERSRRLAIEFARAEGLGQARCAFDLVAIDAAENGVFELGGAALPAPKLTPSSGQLTSLALGACTLGAALGDHVSRLFAERRMSLALALDSLGNRMLLEASRVLGDLVHGLVAKRGLTLSGELRPGDPGLELQAQPTVLVLAGAETIGLSCTSGLSLSPAKSASVVYGVGRDLPAATWSRCDDCRSRDTCRVRD